MPSAIDAIKEGRASTYKIRRKHCKIRPAKDAGRNPRTDFGEIPTLAAQIAEHGIQTPLTGTMEGKFFMVGHGERRLAAFDYAVEHFNLNPKGEKGLIPVEAEGFNPKTADRDRLILHVVLNESKPLNQFEKGAAMKRLLDDHGMSQEEVATQLGCSLTHVTDCLKLVNEAAPELQDAVSTGRLSPTTAIDLIREVPDTTAQATILQTAQAAATASGSDRITAKHIPVATGKRAQATRRNGSTPFDGKDSTPDTATSNAKGEYTQGVLEAEIPFSSRKVKASVLTAKIGSTIHVGWRATWPGRGKGDGFKLVHPSTDGITTDTPSSAYILGLQQIRAEIELKEFKDKETALADIDVLLAAAITAKPSPAAPTPAAKPSDGIENPVIKDKTPLDDLKDLIGAIEAKDAEKDRHATAKKVYGFLKGKVLRVDLVKYIMGI